MTTQTETQAASFKSVRLGRDFTLAMLDAMRYVGSESPGLRNGYIHTDDNGIHHIYGTDGYVMANYDFDNLGCTLEGAFNVSHIKLKANDQVSGELIAPNTIKIEVYNKKGKTDHIVTLLPGSVEHAYPVSSSKSILEGANYSTSVYTDSIDQFKKVLSIFVNDHKAYDDVFIKFYTRDSHCDLRVGYMQDATNNHVAEIPTMHFLKNNGVASMPSIKIKYIKKVFESMESLNPAFPRLDFLMGDNLKPVTARFNSDTFKARILIMPLNRA